MRKANNDHPAQPAPLSALLTIEQAMQILQISSKTTMYDLINRRGLAVVRLGGIGNNHVRIRPEALQAWILAQEQQRVG